jgi:pyruvate dehydrogenase E2 component (dihydrolipoamide acetyltransferase)
MAEFLMPQLGADMSAGKLLRWRKKAGDRVQRGDIVADVETDKADIEIEIFTSGVIERIIVQPGEKVPVGTVLAIIRREGEVSQPEAIPLRPAGPGERTPVTAAVPKHPPPEKPFLITNRESRLHISPAARKIAAGLGIDPASIQGTGPGGRVTIEDIQRGAKARAEPQPEVEPDRQVRMRQAIAAAMARSKREIPHYYLSTTINMSRAVTWLAQVNLQRSIEDRLLYGALLIKAVALALREAPELNTVWSNGKAIQCSDVHVGIAISLRGGGLVAPALHHADRQSLDELMKNFRDLIQRARAFSLRSSELSDPTITVTSLGEQGVETVYGIIYPPQVAIVGFGKLVERPWSSEGRIISQQVINATLAADHRVSDGHRGALFLAALDHKLQEPEKL